MKKRVFAYLMISLLVFCSISAQTTPKKVNPVGKWKFEAPYAPEGYNSGIIEFSFADNKYSTLISMPGSEYKIPGEQTKVENDTVSFFLLLDGAQISINLKTESDVKMTGIAVAPDGEIPLTLTKEEPQK
jgi:hypothetical protein